MASMDNSPLNRRVAEEEEEGLHSDSSVTPTSTHGGARMNCKWQATGVAGALLVITAMAGALVLYGRSHAGRSTIGMSGAVSSGEGLIALDEYQSGCTIPCGAGTCSSELGAMMSTESMPDGLSCCQALSLILLQCQDCVDCNPDGSDMCFGTCASSSVTPAPTAAAVTTAAPAPATPAPTAAAATPAPAPATESPTPAPTDTPEPTAAPTLAPTAAPTEIPGASDLR